MQLASDAPVTKTVQAVQTSSTDDDLSSLDDSDYLLVCQLSAMARTCDFCSSPEHLLRQCSKFAQLAKNASAARRILYALRDRTNNSSSATQATSSRVDSRASTPKISNRSSSDVRQIESQDPETTDDDATEDEASIVPFDESSDDTADFPYAGV